MPFTDTAGSRALWINVKDNSWADVLRATQAGLVNRHYHPDEVFAYTISGKWGYLERPWTASAGDFVYEALGRGTPWSPLWWASSSGTRLSAMSHDFSVDVIVTPTQVIECGPPRRPVGILWSELDPAKIAAIPALASRATRRPVSDL